MIKTKINNTQAESKSRLCGKLDETVGVNPLCWHKGSIKRGMAGWAKRYIGKYVKKHC